MRWGRGHACRRSLAEPGAARFAGIAAFKSLLLQEAGFSTSRFSTIENSRVPVAVPTTISHRQVHRHALALGEAVEHAFERELAAALLVATV
jgi:hypothetical protein